MEDTPEALKPIYTTLTPNSEIILYEGELEISNEQGTLKFSNGVVYVCWLPEPMLKFRVSPNESQSPASLALAYQFVQHNNDFEVKLVSKGMAANAYISKINGVIEGVFTQPLMNQTDEPLNYIIFHIVNFIGFWGAADYVKRDGQGSYRDRTVFTSKTWKLTIDAVDKQGELMKALHISKGYAITHVARLEKTDGSTTTVKEVEQVISNLFWYLSFLKSSFCLPIFLEGYRNNDEKIFEKWEVMRVLPIDNRFSWFPLTKHQQASKTFTRFMELMDNELWENILVPAIEWYVGSQKGLHLGVEIVSSQIGIELLAWAKFVEIDKSTTKADFKKSNAAERMSLLLKWIGIPLSIPTELVNLTKYAECIKQTKNTVWNTGTQAIAEIRNSVAHPDLRDRVSKMPPEAQCEARELGIWYLELALLKLLDYDGLYHNRLNSETNIQSELVPWMAK